MSEHFILRFSNAKRAASGIPVSLQLRGSVDFSAVEVSGEEFLFRGSCSWQIGSFQQTEPFKAKAKADNGVFRDVWASDWHQRVLVEEALKSRTPADFTDQAQELGLHFGVVPFRDGGGAVGFFLSREPTRKEEKAVKTQAQAEFDRVRMAEIWKEHHDHLPPSQVKFQKTLRVKRVTGGKWMVYAQGIAPRPFMMNGLPLLRRQYLKAGGRYV
jgi:hypothetical protein